ncbi:NUDIX domain-containing protein [Phyllobacterium lublinensis]|jgi:predicted NUDIX family NTP pyrophosphohydrolase|uniref:NUDIX domain-containing protein n=1 Tax=Phyllobacterium lublinensis TaxID=2875708 RepID=UPI001CCDFDA2|nr:NUDIX domain-containing protein [Phyllobacterium sp. 2063]MBZ9655190.1 NUDIX domain-containing protein [Phyllobacterium sp. 2063]
MPRKSAGILMYRNDGGGLRVLLVHPGGPFWRTKDTGAWSVPKGEHGEDEDPETAARREFHEETGHMLHGTVHSLGNIRQAGGKLVTCFAVEGTFDTASLTSNTFELEWPPRSGVLQSFPEVDKAAWFTIPEANTKIIPGQRPFFDRLEALVAAAGGRSVP